MFEGGVNQMKPLKYKCEKCGFEHRSNFDVPFQISCLDRTEYFCPMCLLDFMKNNFPIKIEESEDE